MSNRIHWVDYAKALGIFGVVLLHTNINENISHLIHISVIPLFFFLSGIFSISDTQRSFFSSLLRRNGKLLITYFFFNVISFLFWYYLGRHYGADADWNIDPTLALKGIIIGNSSSLIHNAPLWFLSCLIIVHTFHYLIYYFVRSKHIRIFMFILVYIISYAIYSLDIKQLPWEINSAFSMISYYTAGNLMRDYLFQKENWFNRNIKRQGLLTLCFFILIIIIYVMNPKPNVASNTLGNYILFTIGAFSGIFAVITFMKIAEYFFDYIKIISFVGRNTLIILCVHLMAASAVKAITFWGFNLPLSIYDSDLMSFVLAIFSIIVLTPVIYFINRFLPFAVGKKYKF